MGPRDIALMDRWTHQRDPEAFKELAIRYGPMVYGTCLRILRNSADAEDAVQDCFLKLVNQHAPLRLSFAGWLHRVAISCALDRLRSRRRRQKREAHPPRQTPTSQLAGWEEVRSHVDEAIEALPEELREVLVRHFLEDETHDAISRDLGISRSAVSYRIKRGIEAIRGFLKKRGASLSASALPVLMADLTVTPMPSALSANLGRMALAVSAASAPGSTMSAVASKLTGIVGSVAMVKKVLIGVAAVLLLSVGLHHVSVRAPTEHGARKQEGSIPERSAGAPSVSAGRTVGPAHARGIRDDPQTRASRVDPGRTQGPSAEEQGAAQESKGDAQEPTHAISGRVVDSTGDAVAKARVVASLQNAQWGDGKNPEQTFNATTGRNGAFRLENLPEGLFAVGASKVATGLGYLEGVPSGSEDVVIPLKAGSQATGRVYDADTGEGIEGVVVVAEPQNQDVAALEDRYFARLLARKTDARGDYSLQIFPERTYRISVKDAGAYIVPPPFPELLTLREGEEFEKVDFALRIGSGISGTVFDPAGEGVADANVVLMELSHNRFRRIVSAADGAFQFAGLHPEGTYALFAQHDVHGPSGTKSVVMPAVKEVVDVDLHLGQGHRIHGRVIDTDGHAVADLELRLVTFRSDTGISLGSSYGKPVVTDEYGSFVFQNVGSGSYCYCIDTSSDYSLVGSLGFFMPPDRDLQDIEVVVESKTSGSIGGSVVDEDGWGIARAFVFASSTGAKSILGHAYSHEDGSFIIEGLGGSETYTLTVTKPGYAEEKVGNVSVNSSGNCVVLRRAGSIHGRVVSASSGDPIEEFEMRIPERHDAEQNKARATADAWTEYKDPLGEFLLVDRAPGLVRLEANAKGYRITRTDVIEISSGRTVEVGEISLAPDACVVGTVVSNRGVPLAGARVSLFKDAQELYLLRQGIGGGSYAITETDGEGVFRLENLEPDTKIRLAAWCDGYALSAVLDAQVRLEGPTEVSFVLATEGRLSGIVREEGKPVSRFSVVLKKEERAFPFMTSSLTDAEGRYTLTELPEGQYSVQVFQTTTTAPNEAGYRSCWRGKVEMGEGQKKDFDIDLDGPSFR